MSKNKRKISWWFDRPLNSERVRIIISNPIDSKKLGDCIRDSRKGINKVFKVTKETLKRL